MRSLVLGAVLLVAAAAIWAVPFLTREQEYAAVTPQPDPLFTQTDIPLAGGGEVCVDGAVLDAYSEVAHLRPSGGPVPLELTLRGDGYDAAARIDGTYADHELVRVAIEPPREPVATTICVRNLGDVRVRLAAADDRTNARRPTAVDGQPVPQNFVLLFSESEARSIAERMPLNLERASAFRPVSPVLLWPIVLLFAIGVPLGILAAVRKGD